MLSRPRHSRAPWGLIVAALLPGACAAPADHEPPPEVVDQAPAALVEEREPVSLPDLPDAPRGLGSMSARIPGTSAVVGGVHLASHEARVTIHEGVAHTEIEEEFRNDTGQVLEGRLLFPLPTEATLGRLGLWVGRDLVEGEVVEKNRADRIFRGIVDDSVRPRDPALLDVVAGGTLSLRVYPIPAHGSRRVLYSFDQVVRRSGGQFHYVHPLSLGADRATPIGHLRVSINGVVRLDEQDIVPAADLVVPLDEEPPAIAVSAGGGAEPAVLLRQMVEAPEGARRFAGDVVVALDVSEGQSAASLTAQLHLANEVLRGLGPDESFVLLACDAACVSYPAAGRAVATPEALDEARLFLAGLEVGGASDPAGALVAASRRLDAARPGQILLLSDGTATAGELSVSGILAHAAPHVVGVDVRVVGVGRAVDDRALAGLARGIGATYDRLATGEPLARRAVVLAESRREPVNRAPRVLVPEGVTDPEPADAPPTRAGDEILVLGRATGPVEGAVATEAPLARLRAREQIARLEERDDDATRAAITALSVRHHVLARTTSFLVLENDRMFAEFGIPRTTPGPDLPDGAPRLTGTHVARPPQIRSGSYKVTGRLPAEIVQRIVRQNFGRFRACYGDGLRRNPSLAGRVVTRFVIDRTGNVAAVADGGSDIGDRAVVACVNKSFAGLIFPEPEGGIVAVEYPITFRPTAPGETPPPSAPHTVPPGRRQRGYPDWGPRLPANSALNPRPVEPPPPGKATVVHWAGDDRWIPASDPASARPALVTRHAHLDRIRSRLAAGHMEDAYSLAATLVRLDPDLPAAREALAESAAALGRREEATRAVAAASALDPRSVGRHLTAARAALAVGDGERACAHLRSLGELSPKEHAAQADACRAGRAPSIAAPAAAGFEARVSCEGAGCPGFAVITPAGRVLSPWTSGSAGPAAATTWVQEGTYRTLLVAGEREGDLTVQALGTSFTAHIAADDPRRTAIFSRVTLPHVRIRSAVVY